MKTIIIILPNKINCLDLNLHYHNDLLKLINLVNKFLHTINLLKFVNNLQKQDFLILILFLLIQLNIYNNKQYMNLKLL